MTEAIRRLFDSSAESFLTPRGIRAQLTERGFEFSKQPLIAIHNTLKRLAAQGELEEVRNKRSKVEGYKQVSVLLQTFKQIEKKNILRKKSGE